MVLRFNLKTQQKGQMVSFTDKMINLKEITYLTYCQINLNNTFGLKIKCDVFKLITIFGI